MMKIMTKKINVLLMCLLALSMGIMSSCDDTMDGNTTLGFPTDTLMVEAAPGETVPVAFNVGYNWKINSDRDWCRINGEDKSTGGKAGNHTVNFVVSALGNLFSDDQATITLYMNGESRVIAYIVRRASIGYEMEVSDAQHVYADGESIVIGAEGKLVLELEPNFNIDLLKYDFPSWAQIGREGKALTIGVVTDSLKYVISNESDSLRMYKDSTFYTSFHLQYLGMSPQAIRISHPLEAMLVVSHDAEQASVNGESCKMPVSFSIAALNDEYEILTFAYDNINGYYPLEGDDVWVDIHDDSYGNVNIAVTKINGGLDRTLLLSALPQAIVDSLGGNDFVLDFLCEEVEGVFNLRESAEQYCMASVMQEGTAITISPETQWNLRVAVDGKTYHDAIKGDTCVAPMNVEIETPRGYELMCARYDSKVGCQIVEVEDSWLEVSDDKQGNVNINFKENVGNERILYLFALPVPFVEGLEPESSAYYDNLSDALFTEVGGILELKDEAGQFVVAKFIQEADEANSMKVLRTKNTGMETFEVTKETDPEWLAIATAKGVEANRVFRCSLELGSVFKNDDGEVFYQCYSYIINPLLPLNVWDTDHDPKDRIEIYGLSGKKYESGKDKDYSEEHTMMEEIEGNYMLVTLSANVKAVNEDCTLDYCIDEDFIVYFIDNETNCLKALVINRL